MYSFDIGSQRKACTKGEGMTICKSCEHFEPGFLSEPDECSFFKEVYKWFVYFNTDGSRTKDGEAPDWCPLNKE